MLDLGKDQIKHAFVLQPQVDLIVDEKRSSPRFPWFAEIDVTLLPTLEVAARPVRVLKVVAENIAKGGICIFCDRPIARGTVVRCEIGLSDGIAFIPTLLKVRWNYFAKDKKQYRVGLEFLL
jgi:hypothetical protein